MGDPDLFGISERRGLSTSETDVKLRSSRPKREASIKEAVAWPRGKDSSHQLFTALYQRGGYEIRLCKPGKEAERKKKANINDMTPRVAENGELLEVIPTFEQIMNWLKDAAGKHHRGLELLGALIFRAAFMLDHGNVAAGRPHDTGWRLNLSEDLLSELDTMLFGGMPGTIFLYLADAIALNEDVKYWTLRNQKLTHVGRPNNLASLAHFTAVLLGGVDSLEVVVPALRMGVFPLGLSRAKDVFPGLR